MFDNISMTLNSETWFIPFDILMILFSAFTLIFCIIFLLISIFDKTCHTVTILLVSNSCLAVFAFGSVRLLMTIFTLKNDLKQIQYEYLSCIFLGYLSYVLFIVQNYSFFQQSSYRYIKIIHPTRLFYQSYKFHFFVICLIWIFAFIYGIPHILTGQIQFDINDQICQVPFGLSVLTFCNAFLAYIIPTSLIICIYIKLVRYVQQMSKNVAPANTLFHARRELKMVRRLVILVTGVVTIGAPYVSLMVVSFFTNPPKYRFRIAYIFVDTSVLFVIIALFQLTEPVKVSLMKKINGINNMVLPTMT